MRAFSLISIFIGLSTLAFSQNSSSETLQYKTPELTLEGTLTLPAKPTKKMPLIVLVAGSGPTDRDGNNPLPPPNSLKANSYRMLADSLNARGIAVFRYDKRGSGQNIREAAQKIKPEDHRFDFYIADAVGFIKQLQADKRFSKVVVAGHSEGSLVGMVAAQQTNADGFVSIAGPGRNIADVLKTQFKTALPDTLQPTANQLLDSLKAGKIVQQVPLLFLNFFNPKMQPGLISWMKYEPTVELKKLRKPVLIIQGKRDIQVALSEAESLKAARPDARLIVFDQMNHILKDVATDDRAENLKTYTQAELPLTAGVSGAIADFVQKIN